MIHLTTLSYKFNQRNHLLKLIVLILFLSPLSFSACVTVGSSSVTLLYPTGGETLSGIVTIKWVTELQDNESVKIYIYLNIDGAWLPLKEDIPNSGYVEWDTTSYLDGRYRLMIEAVDSNNYISFDTTDDFIIDNNNSVIKILNVSVSTADGYHCIKNGDTVFINATIMNGEKLDRNDIIANLSCFGINYSPAQFFDGEKASWTVYNVHCTPLNGEAMITISINGIEQYSKRILIDNTPPEIVITHPSSPGVYFLNKFIFPSRSIYMLCAVSIEGEIIENTGVSSVDIYVDSFLRKSLHPTGNHFKWSFEGTLIGYHKIDIRVTDLSGFETSDHIDIYAFKIIYIK